MPVELGVLYAEVQLSLQQLRSQVEEAKTLLRSLTGDVASGATQAAEAAERGVDEAAKAQKQAAQEAAAELRKQAAAVLADANKQAVALEATARKQAAAIMATAQQQARAVVAAADKQNAEAVKAAREQSAAIVSAAKVEQVEVVQSAKVEAAGVKEAAKEAAKAKRDEVDKLKEFQGWLRGEGAKGEKEAAEAKKKADREAREAERNAERDRVAKELKAVEDAALKSELDRLAELNRARDQAARAAQRERDAVRRGGEREVAAGLAEGRGLLAASPRQLQDAELARLRSQLTNWRNLEARIGAAPPGPPAPPVQRFTTAFKEFGDEFRRQVWSPVGMMMRDLATKLERLGLAGVGAFSLLTKAGGDWEYTLNKVRNNTLLKGDEFGFLRQNVERLGVESGASLEKLALGWMHAINLGFHFQEALTIVNQGMRTAVATGADEEKTIELLAKVMKEYNFEVKDTERVNAVLFKGAAIGNMTFEQFARSSNRALGMAANLKVPIEQVAAVFATLTQHGMDATQAQTQLVNVMNKVTQPTAATRKELENLDRILKEHGVTSVSLSRDFTQEGLANRKLTGIFADLARAADVLHQSHSRLSQTAFPNLRATLAGLIITGTGAKDFLHNFGEIEKALVDENDRYHRSLHTLHQQLGQLQNRFVLLAAQVLSVLKPSLESLMDTVRRAFEWFSRLSPGTQEALVKLGAFGSVALVVAGQVLRLVTTLVQLRVALAAAAGTAALTGGGGVASGGLLTWLGGAGAGNAAARGALSLGGLGLIAGGAYGLYRLGTGAAEASMRADAALARAADSPALGPFVQRRNELWQQILDLKSLPPGTASPYGKGTIAADIKYLEQKLAVVEAGLQKVLKPYQGAAASARVAKHNEDIVNTLTNIQQELATSTQLLPDRKAALLQSQAHWLNEARRVHLELPYTLDPDRATRESQEAMKRIGLTDKPGDPFGAKAWEKQQKEAAAAAKRAAREAEREQERLVEERKQALTQVAEDLFNLTHDDFQQRMRRANRELADVLSLKPDKQLANLAKARHSAEYRKVFEEEFDAVLDARLEQQRQAEAELKEQQDRWDEVYERYVKFTLPMVDQEYRDAWRQYWDDIVGAQRPRLNELTEAFELAESALAEVNLGQQLSRIDGEVRAADRQLRESLHTLSDGMAHGWYVLTQELNKAKLDLPFETAQGNELDEYILHFKDSVQEVVREWETAARFQHDTGQLSTRDFIAFLQEELQYLDYFSDEWLKTAKEVYDLQQQLRKATIGSLLKEQVTKFGLNEVRQFTSGAKRLFVDLFDNLISGHKNWLKSFLDDFKRMLTQMLAELLASQLFQALSGLFGGGRKANFGQDVLGQATGSLFGGLFDAGFGVLFGGLFGGGGGGGGALGSTLGDIAGGIGSFLGFDRGGLVPGPTGAARAAVVHGGELVLTRAQQAALGRPAVVIQVSGDHHYHGEMDADTAFDRWTWKAKQLLKSRVGTGR